MPDITNAVTAEITVNKRTLKAPMPYKAGDVLTANEASALNQTYHENLRNNTAKKIEEWEAEGKDVQEEFTKYAAEYEFGVRTPRTKDPIRAIAIDIALDRIRAALKKAGHNLKDFSADDLRERAETAVDENPKLLEAAKNMHAARQAALADD